MNPSNNPSALRSKKIIMNTLVSLMKQTLYQEITVKQIILESGISRKTFYRNFSSKDDVLVACIDGVLLQYLETIFKHEAYNIMPMMDIIFSFCEKNKEFLIMLHDNELLYLVIARLNRMIPEQHKKITTTTNTQNMSKYILSFNIGGVWNIIERWIDNSMIDDCNEIKEVILKYLVNISNVDLRDI